MKQAVIKKGIIILGAGVLAGGYLGVAGTANAQPNCQGGFSPWGGGSYCDGQGYSDGSYDHCANVSVMGFGGMQCGRVCPPPPGSSIPAPWPGTGPGGRC
jgi:hypothetical protein